MERNKERWEAYKWTYRQTDEWTDVR